MPRSPLHPLAEPTWGVALLVNASRCCSSRHGSLLSTTTCLQAPCLKKRKVKRPWWEWASLTIRSSSSCCLVLMAARAPANQVLWHRQPCRDSKCMRLVMLGACETISQCSACSC